MAEDIKCELLFSSRNEIGEPKSSTDPEPSPEIIEWLNGLALLRGVPLNYLLPDERMLPEESIRFFYIDNNWIKNLLDGACSIGRHHKEHSDDENVIPYPKVGSCLTGFLLRSMLVEGWPGLEVLGYGKDGEELPKERTERLSSSVLLCIFENELSRLIIRKPAEALHFAFEVDNEKLVKKTRTNGEIEVPFRNKESRVIDIKKLAEKFVGNPLCSSAVFASQMVDSGDEIVFKIGDY
jgi:hypothetical protein